MKPLSLPLSEVSVISVITRQRGLPHAFLLEQVNKIGLSRDGMAVIRAVLGIGKSKRAAAVAANFMEWADSLPPRRRRK